MDRWPHQDFALAEIPRRIASGERRICVTSPTGGGKTQIICDFIDWAIGRGRKAIVYTNRKLLVTQLSKVLDRHGLTFGVRAAGYEDRRELPVQVSSLPTENRRVIKDEKWEVHGHGERVLAIVDEAHLNAGPTAEAVLKRHHDAGGVCLGFTATPIGLKHLYDTLVVAGTPSQLRACGALVPAYHYGPDEPDMSKFKQSIKTGEYTEKDLKKAIMTKAIIGRVIENYRRLNPEQKPTLLFGPGVAESIWFAEQLTKAGIRAAHIDGAGVWVDGDYQKTTDREWLLREFRSGEINVLCNRFVLREGIDLPEIHHLILATVFGGLQTYLQSCGRGLRAFPGKSRCVIQDHGGHWWRHGSVNMDRQWDLAYTENILAGVRADTFREKKETEPIMCPQCGLIRASGSVCPTCKYEAKIRSRKVIELDGTIREHEGDVFKPRRVAMKRNTVQLWTQCYFRTKNSKNKMTFRQAEGLFFYEQHYYPPRDLPYMPVDKMDWFLPVASVPKERLST